MNYIFKVNLKKKKKNSQEVQFESLSSLVEKKKTADSQTLLVPCILFIGT